MPGDKKFELGDYVEVKDRIAIFYELYPKGRLVSGEPAVVDVGGTPYFLIQARAYRTPDDPHPGVGTSWMAIPGSTPYTRGSEAENVETSAWGRAIGSLGILIDKSIATSNEIDNKRADEPKQDGGVIATDEYPMSTLVREAASEGGLIGTAVAQGNHDFNIRQTPNGWALPFRVKAGRSGFIVRAEDQLAQALDLIKAEVIDQRVTVWGRWEDQVIPATNTKPPIKFRVLVLARIKWPEGVLPAPGIDEPPEDMLLPGEGGPVQSNLEAESEPMGLVP